MYHLCPDPVTPQAPSQGRTACDFTTATISLGVFFKPHCTCEEDIYFLHKKEELSYSIKFPPAILFHFANIYRIVDSTQTPNQQSGWSVFFPYGNPHFDDQNQPSGFQNQQSGSQNQQRGAQNQQRGTQNQQSGKARNNKSGRASYM